MEAENSYARYKFLVIGGENNIHSFSTDNDISYEVKFKPSDYVFEGRTTFYVPTFELSIEVAINETGKNPPLDKKISYTIAAIFKDFFQKNSNQVIIYICDSSDSRQAARKRKFDTWTNVLKDGEFVKFDIEIIDSTGIIYYNSAILRSDNPYRSQILDSFIELANEQSK